jgi:hypothetical protein
MLQRGMAAWLEQCSSLPSIAEQRPASPIGNEQRLADEQCDELIDLLSNLALTRLKEVPHDITSAPENHPLASQARGVSIREAIVDAAGV